MALHYLARAKVRFWNCPLLSKFNLLFRLSLTTFCFRERKEFAAFRELLRMVPGLEARIMQSSEDELVLIADLVSMLCYDLTQVATLMFRVICFRSKRDLTVQERMTPRE